LGKVGGNDETDDPASYTKAKIPRKSRTGAKKIDDLRISVIKVHLMMEERSRWLHRGFSFNPEQNGSVHNDFFTPKGPLVAIIEFETVKKIDVDGFFVGDEPV